MSKTITFIKTCCILILEYPGNIFCGEVSILGIDQLKMLGEGPYPLPMNKFYEINNIYLDTDICIIISKLPMDFPEKAHHVHDSYEFTIPSTAMPYVNIENKCFYTEKNKILPFNSGQAHGSFRHMRNIRLISLNVDNDALNEIAYSIFGKSNVSFKQGDYVFTNKLKTLINSFIEEHNHHQPGHKLVLKSLSTQIVVHLLRNIDSNMPLLVSSKYSTAKKNIDKAIEYIRDQYSEEVSLEEVAKIAHLTPYHFIKVFKAYTGKTPYEYLLQVKIHRAKELLSSRNLTITEICFMCGFNSLSNFTTYFKKKVGVSPSEYRKILSNRYR
jgi:AraC family transcriptional regulator